MSPNDIKKIESFVRILDQHDVPPDDTEQEVIEKVGNRRDPAALPPLRRALSSAVEYQRWAEALRESVNPSAPGSAMPSIMGEMARRMESRLRTAIEKCTPEGEPVVYESKKKSFFKKLFG